MCDHHEQQSRSNALKLSYNPKFMRQASKLSLQRMLLNKGGPFGAVIVKGDKIIAKGYNKVTSHLDPTAHAEVTAIRNACKKLARFDLKGCVIYSSCEPCPMCLSAIYWARLDGIYYAQTQEDAAAIGFDDAFLYREVSLPKPQRSLPILHFPDDLAKQAMQAWMEKEDKISY